MGFTVYYRSTRPVTKAESEVIQQAVDAANSGRTWLHCEGVHFFPIEDDGFLLGGSKPNFLPHPDDAGAAAQEGLPNGTCRDMLDVLSQVSRDFGIDWILSHDYDPNIGAVRAGILDPGVINQIEAFADLGDILGDLDLDVDA
ncbi:hypothetical protein ACYOEI_19695 [Singulisphaera rosea]